MSDRHAAAVTTLSWIPSEAIEDAPLLKAPFSMRLLHYDTPPPDRLPDLSLEQLADDDAFRFAHRLSVSIEVEGGRIVSARYESTAGAPWAGPPSGSAPWEPACGACRCRCCAQEPVISATVGHVRADLRRLHRVAGPRLVDDRGRTSGGARRSCGRRCA